MEADFLALEFQKIAFRLGETLVLYQKSRLDAAKRHFLMLDSTEIWKWPKIAHTLWCFVVHGIVV